MTPTLADFEAFCAELTLDNGKPMVLEDFQRAMLADYFDGVRETVILQPKKNGKTTTLSALALFHLVAVADASCVVAAASRDQASILFDFARGFVGRSRSLQTQIVVRAGYRELWAADGTGKLKVLASDVDTGDGVLPSLALVDELGRHKSGDLYGVPRDGCGPRQGQMVTISTAGDDEESPLGKLRAKAHALPNLTREGAYRYARSDDFALHEWALDSNDDLDDLALVASANPSSWQTIAELAKRKDSPSMTPWQWARFAAGVWVHGEHGAISDKEWAACAEPGVEPPPGATGVYCGLDLAWRGPDTTALCALWRESPERVIVAKPAVLTAPGDGTSIEAGAIWTAIAELVARWPGLTIVADPNAGAPELLQKIERELPHVTLAEYPQAPHAMAMAAGRLQEAIATGTLRHPDDETLTRHVLAAVPATVGEGYRFKKAGRATRPIDALIALAMAYSTLIGEEQKPRYSGAQGF